MKSASCYKNDGRAYEQQINGREEGSDDMNLERDILIVCEAG